MKRIYLFIFFAFVFSQKTYADDCFQIHYLNIDENENEFWISQKITFGENISNEEKYFFVIQNLFSDEDINYIPRNVKLLNVFLSNGLLVINVSKEIYNYGGSYTETRVANQILKTAFSIKGVQRVSLFIESSLMALPEGTIIEEEVGYDNLY